MKEFSSSSHWNSCTGSTGCSVYLDNCGKTPSFPLPTLSRTIAKLYMQMGLFGLWSRDSLSGVLPAHLTNTLPLELSAQSSRFNSSELLQEKWQIQLWVPQWILNTQLHQVPSKQNYEQWVPKWEKVHTVHFLSSKEGRWVERIKT